MTAIVYCSKTGHTAQYARLLAQRLDLPAYALSGAAAAVPRGAEVVFLTWLRAGAPCAWRQAAKRWRVAALGVVGMAENGASQLPEVARRCALDEAFPLFYLPGGYERDKLRGVSRWLMDLVGRRMTRTLLAQDALTDADRTVLALWKDGGSLVDVKYLAPLAVWCQRALEDAGGAAASRP
ncbi:MAG: hypothetical protein HFF17_03860 [Oscillospiraceae bacterium]|nr:hypothetical protein [Oscillospiraceae bacterium]